MLLASLQDVGRLGCSGFPIWNDDPTFPKLASARSFGLMPSGAVMAWTH